MSLYIVALIIGIVAGLRAFVAPAAIGWLAYTKPTHFADTWASFMTSVWAMGIFSILVIVEFVTDQLPKTPSRKVPQSEQVLMHAGSAATRPTRERAFLPRCHRPRVSAAGPLSQLAGRAPPRKF
jgi:uncharacterized membrane protein